MNLHFIVNPVAKNGFCLKIWQMINTYLDEQQITYEVYFTEQSGDGRKLAIQILEATNEPLTIIAVGGDGTIHEVMNGACAYRHGLIGFIPAGSGNDFSRGFSVPKEPLNALKTMLRLLEQYKRDELIRYIDSGKYIIGENRGIFVNNMGCGFDASVALKANKSAIKKVLNRLSLGKLVYFFVFLKEIFQFQPGELAIEIDQQNVHFEKAWFVTISNHPYFGGGIKISPQSNPEDGLLEVTVVHNITRWKILFMFVTILWGGHTKLKEVFTAQGKQITIYNRNRWPIHADGEHAGTGDIHIQIQQGIIPFFKYKKAATVGRFDHEFSKDNKLKG